ncbi:MAG: DUF3891 family protein [Myxococcota bacterium]
MLLQHRSQHLRLIQQHDHGTLTGELAQAWPTPLPFPTLLAIALHDLPWMSPDALPELNPNTKQPYSFVDYPRTERLVLYKHGLDQLADLHPYVGTLVSLHYATFQGMSHAEIFQKHEEHRRARLIERFCYEAEQLQHDLAWLKALDLLSLYICLTPPHAQPQSRPSWLLPNATLTPPSGPPVMLDWVDEHRLKLTPCPWGGTLSTAIPYLELEGDCWETQEALQDAISRGEHGVWHVEIGV